MHTGKFKRKFNFSAILARVTLWVGLAAMAIGAGGCLAASLAPLAAQGVGMIANMLGETTAVSTMVAHNKDKSSQEQEVEADFDDNDFNNNDQKKRANENKCDELVLITPSIIEFRADQTGATRWRELGLAGSPYSPQWGVMQQKDAAANGWLPATNIAQMSFNPPLRQLASPGDGTYLAYAPAQSQTEIERDQLASLEYNFGPATGTFQFNGRLYAYSTINRLPCFPTPQ